MIRLVFTILALFSLTQWSLSQDLVKFKEKSFISGQDTLLYRLLYPNNFDKGQTYPLLLFLHGAGERGSDNERQLIHGAKMFMNEENLEKYPAVVLFPQCPKEGYWAQVDVDRTVSPRIFDFDYSRGLKKSLELTLELVDEMARESYIDNNRLYVMGLSMGGMGTFQAIFARPDLFAAAVPICGGADVNAFGTEHSSVPFWIFHGDADNVVSVQHSRAMQQKLLALDAYVSYTEYYGVDHGSWNNAFIEPNLLNWMFSKKKKVGLLAD